jgi:shikimate 5-dehydrogenase
MPRYFLFIGVTTAESSINRIFPRWRDRLGLGADLELLGVDLPVRAPAASYRAVVQRMRSDPHQVGAIITTHKLDLFAATHDLFDEVDPVAELCEELSCIGKRSGRLVGWARDPLTAGRALDRILGPNYFLKSGGQVLCLGAGGAGSAITLYLMTLRPAEDRPRQIIVTDLEPGRLERLRALHSRLDADVFVHYRENADPRVHDELIAALPPASIVINATGMGKDLPGSPITASARFPERAIAWDLNYRGELGFLRIAGAQATEWKVRVEDGWYNFIQGWAVNMEEVFHRPISTEELEQLAEDAAFARPSSPAAARE